MCPYLLGNVAAEGAASAVAFAPYVLNGGGLSVDYHGDAHLHNVGVGGVALEVGDEGEQQGLEAFGLFVIDGCGAAVDVVGDEGGVVGAAVGHVEVCAGADIGL